MIYLAPRNNHLRSLGGTKIKRLFFSLAKKALADLAMLIHPVPDAELRLLTDTSSVAVGAILQQNGSGWQPLEVFSYKFKEAHKKYSTLARDLL